MKLPRRQFLHLAAGAAVLPAVSRMARAQAYPTRPVRIFVPFAPGGPNDALARLIGQWLSERLGQQFVIDNRTGGGGNIGTEAALRSAPDGYTLLQVGPSHAINATLYNNLNFNFIRDVAPIASISTQPQVVVVHPSVPARSILELIAYAKSKPDMLIMASAGIGTGPHLTGELFKMMSGITLTHVPYRGAGPAVTDLLGGRVQVAFVGPPSSIEHIRAGTLRALGVTSLTRWDGLPDVPAVAEFVPGYEAISWFGFGAPKNTPADVIAILSREINAGLADPKIKARLADLGSGPLVLSTADFGKLIVEETEKWAKVIKFAGIKPE
jgi:tripartite-type tricarboxylate transporter receptor subunit TctC